MASATEHYVPGSCNIGKAEIRQRRQTGWLGLSVTAALWLVFLIFHVNAPWRLTLFLPASLGATGFLQAAMRFCAGFGMQGFYNFGTEVGKVLRVEDRAARMKDRRRAQIIILLSAACGVAVALAGYFTAS